MGDIYYEWITGKKEEKMTREEAIRIFRKEIECLSHTKCEDCILKKDCDPMNTTPYDSEYIEAYRVAIKALEQEPCGKDINVPATDAISRQDVVKAVDKHTDDDGTLDDDITCILEDVPSVTPQPKTGHWILLDECSNSGYYCSECHKKVVKEGWSETVKKIKFCPNCGCRMMEVENG